MAKTKELFDMVFLLTTKFNRNLEAAAAKVGLKLSQLVVLADIMEFPDSRLTDVCSRRGLSRGAVSKIVDSLVVAGLVNRIEAKDDRRNVKLSVTSGFDHSALCAPETFLETFPGLSDTEGVSQLDLALDGIKVLKTLLEEKK